MEDQETPNEPQQGELVTPGPREIGEGTTVISYHQGPLPSAAEFAAYDKVLPGTADRVLKMAESQSSHRRFVEKTVVIADSIKSVGGLVVGAFIALFGMWYGYQLIQDGKSWEGFVAILTPLASIVGAFLLKEKWNKDSTGQ